MLQDTLQFCYIITYFKLRISACSSRSIGQREVSIYLCHWRSCGLHASRHLSISGLLGMYSAMSSSAYPTFFYPVHCCKSFSPQSEDLARKFPLSLLQQRFGASTCVTSRICYSLCVTYLTLCVVCVTYLTLCVVCDRRRCYTTPLKTRIQLWRRSKNTSVIKWQVDDIIVIAFDTRLDRLYVDTILDGLYNDKTGWVVYGYKIGSPVF